MSQHLVSENNPYASRAVMLAAAARIRKGAIFRHRTGFGLRTGFQHVYSARWYRRSANVYRRPETCVFALPRTLSLPTQKRIRIVRYNASHQEALLEIASAARGSIYIIAEELEHDAELGGG